MSVNGRKLRDEIERVLAHMADARDRSDRLSEADTKAAFIDPILSALGWDLRDVFSVSREYRHKPPDNPVDYALFVARSPVLFVEAKSLNKDMADYKWISQTIAYANAAGVEWCALTNGDEYRIYNAFAKAEADKKLFRRFKLSEQVDREVAVETLQLLSSATLAEKRIDIEWKAQFVDRKVRDAVSKLFNEQDDRLIRLIVKNADELRASDVRDSLRRGDFDIKYPQMNSVSPHAFPNSPRPATIVENGNNESGDNSSRGRMSDLIKAKIITPPTEIEVVFKGQRMTALVEKDGLIYFDGKNYNSPSSAAGFARNKVSGPPPDGRPYWPTNGWTFWKYREPTTGTLAPISQWQDRLKDSAG